ncbi:DUF3105 domain-containing protein [Streptomyces anthocyanicus]|uniref:Cytoplasmic membrane protein FsxA n=1 Tax=Streptomyces lividans 1326 TaxID=1200984 RepID=A0A7U9H9J6_STRLI|nr:MULTISPECIES: DUF3105 domain-containing protein [Streptomyces]EOY45753.1 Cytoplasmic membrane protein FsxA [Streptomyces lividans 1326]KKD12300.1 membrane protein [Streptomyces sp. WM6391]
MGSSKSTARKAARRAHIEQMRRAEQARERRNKIIAVTASAVVVAGTIGGGWYLLSSANDKERQRAAPVRGEQAWSKLSQNHVENKVDYPMTPGAGGDHDQIWQNCDGDVYTKRIEEENAVHSLEHGAVWVTYNDKAADADVAALKKRVSETKYTLMSPYKAQPSPITLTAWGQQLKLDKASDPRVAEFFDKYVQGEQTPEPGAACTGGVG